MCGLIAANTAVKIIIDAKELKAYRIGRGCSHLKAQSLTRSMVAALRRARSSAAFVARAALIAGTISAGGAGFEIMANPFRTLRN
jgi:hypothetical protein